MILAICGRSAVGKTSIAEIMASRLRLPVRHCGLAIRAAAIEANVTLDDLPHPVHRRVDDESLVWCDQQTSLGGVIEGRFLDSVLRARDDVLLVDIVADMDERVVRLAQRTGGGATAEEILAIDVADDAFRAALHKGIARSPSLTLDTTGGTASLWAEKLERYAREQMKLRPD